MLLSPRIWFNFIYLISKLSKSHLVSYQQNLSRYPDINHCECQHQQLDWSISFTQTIQQITSKTFQTADTEQSNHPDWQKVIQIEFKVFTHKTVKKWRLREERKGVEVDWRGDAIIGADLTGQISPGKQPKYLLNHAALLSTRTWQILRPKRTLQNHNHRPFCRRQKPRWSRTDNMQNPVHRTDHIEWPLICPKHQMNIRSWHGSPVHRFGQPSSASFPWLPAPTTLWKCLPVKSKIKQATNLLPPLLCFTYKSFPAMIIDQSSSLRPRGHGSTSPPTTLAGNKFGQQEAPILSVSSLRLGTKRAIKLIQPCFLAFSHIRMKSHCHLGW